MESVVAHGHTNEYIGMFVPVTQVNGTRRALLTEAVMFTVEPYTAVAGSAATALMAGGAALVASFHSRYVVRVSMSSYARRFRPGPPPPPLTVVVRLLWYWVWV